MPVIKLAGMNGSGKSTLMRAIMELYHINHVAETRGANSDRPLVYSDRASKKWVLGSYHTACGGMDTINNQKDKMRLITNYAKPGDLCLFEGILVGVTYGEVGAFSDTEPQRRNGWVYAFMSTPFNICVKRVLERRKEAGNDSPFDPKRSMEPKIKAFAAVERKATAYGHTVYQVDWRDDPKVAAKKLVETAMALGRKR